MRITNRWSQLSSANAPRARHPGVVFVEPVRYQPSSMALNGRLVIGYRINNNPRWTWSKAQTKPSRNPCSTMANRIQTW